MSRLSIEIPSEFHQAIKMMAVEQGVTLRDFVVEKLSDVCKKQPKKPNARLLTSIQEGLELAEKVKSGEIKPYKNAKEIFARYE